MVLSSLNIFENSLRIKIGSLQLKFHKIFFDIVTIHWEIKEKFLQVETDYWAEIYQILLEEFNCKVRMTLNMEFSFRYHFHDFVLKFK
jgi:hypothetical protein